MKHVLMLEGWFPHMVPASQLDGPSLEQRHAGEFCEFGELFAVTEILDGDTTTTSMVIMRRGLEGE